ncbi:spermatogenesis-associated protein 22-like [Cydia strobilella]|uniref:spermatogenesis-associated protein 22-like n=1 Tax=Cydia strobilella TaxID=1100964 RepID=UPI0030041A94
MDRYIIRDTRAGAECLQGNEIIAFPTSTTGNNMIPEQFYTPYGAEFQHVRETRYSLPQKSNAPTPTNMMQGQTQIMSGIDPNYLSAYSSSNAQYTAGKLNEIPRNFESSTPMVNNNCDFKPKQQFIHDSKPLPMLPRNSNEIPRNFESSTPRVNNNRDIKPKQQSINYDIKPKPQTPAQQMPLRNSNVPPKKPNETETPKSESQVLTRLDKLKALHRSGPRVFSGPVEKVLKWHKALQDIGVLIIYEIVAKCVSIQPGTPCSKNLVIRDDNGPAMQVVYYEIDFLLPELKPPCTVRVVGRMMAGTCRLQAFSVRPATGDDVATLSRRAAVASHHVAKLRKEYGASDNM